MRRRQGVERGALEKVAGGEQTAARGRGDSPEARLVQWETVERVRAALDKLPPEQQQIVRLKIADEKTFAAIAAELNLPLGTVLTRMQLALAKRGVSVKLQVA